MSSSTDSSIIELRGNDIEWLSPGGRIVIHGVEYEYENSSDDESIDNRVGLGRTLDRMLKRVSAPVEMFLSYCSELRGNGPEAIFARASPVTSAGNVISSRRPRRLSFWIHRYAAHSMWLVLAVPNVSADLNAMIPFIIDRRYQFSTRLLGAYYMVLLSLSAHNHHRLFHNADYHRALLQICQEVCRRGYPANIMRLLCELVTDIGNNKLRAFDDGLSDIPELLSRPIDMSISLVLLSIQMGILSVCLTAKHGPQVFTTVKRWIWLQRICPRNPNPLEVALWTYIEEYRRRIEDNIDRFESPDYDSEDDIP
ncbi:hypothetical protein NEOLEDRAFT_1173652 [Neolentinus lepideus HHB14362 ss-1]|uniref:Uncharacterized protein n=1 Tax=Neolentinus lepideus HHB14362 ss-1 TaxID=1314782 RepID=A0A165MFI4_9AGAM|nr:hypothetical protein NEOLEDRAFT_1173652 [Neolentinus lepideus HHB14362 ss-1]